MKINDLSAPIRRYAAIETGAKKGFQVDGVLAFEKMRFTQDYIADGHEASEGTARDFGRLAAAFKETLLRHLAPVGSSDRVAAEYLRDNGVAFWTGPATPPGVEHLSGFGDHLGDIRITLSGDSMTVGFRCYSERLECLRAMPKKRGEA